MHKKRSDGVDRLMVHVDPVVAEDFGQFFQKTFDVQKGDINLLVRLLKNIVSLSFFWFLET